MTDPQGRRPTMVATRWQVLVFDRLWAMVTRARGDRGDVPGWVLVTLMTAGLVTALWVLASEQLTALFTRAMQSVSGQP